MSKPISVQIPHSLGKDEARCRIEQGFANVQNQMTGSLFGTVSFKQHWEGDRLHFEGGVMGQRITGRLDVLPQSIQMEIDLPPLLATIADRVKSVLTRETTKLLEKK